MKYHSTLQEARTQLNMDKSKVFTPVLEHGSMVVELYAPKDEDLQTPHKQDELYMIASGTATFNRNGEKTVCRKGDVLFVPAGMTHRFENFSTDFATWVIFYGPEGGEAVR